MAGRLQNADEPTRGYVGSPDLGRRVSKSTRNKGEPSGSEGPARSGLRVRLQRSEVIAVIAVIAVIVVIVVIVAAAAHDHDTLDDAGVAGRS